MFRRPDFSLSMKETKLTASFVCPVVFKMVYSIPPRIVDFLMVHALSPFSGQQIFHVRKTKMGICLRSRQLLKVVQFFALQSPFPNTKATSWSVLGNTAMGLFPKHTWLTPTSSGLVGLSSTSSTNHSRGAFVGMFGNTFSYDILQGSPGPGKEGDELHQQQNLLRHFCPSHYHQPQLCDHCSRSRVYDP